MALITVSIQIPEELWAQVIQSAEYHQATTDAVVYTAVEKFFEPSADDILAIEEGLRQLNAGESFSHEEVMASYHARIFAYKAA
jgi:predicted transcriptional regulator